MRYLAIDYGLKRLGLAICDAEEMIVSPLCQLAGGKNCTAKTVEEIKTVIETYQVEALVVGLPLNMDGSEGEQAKQTRKFAEQLGQAVGVAIDFQDERLSSAAADELLADSGLSAKKRKEKRDMLAACDILQEFLNRKKYESKE